MKMIQFNRRIVLLVGILALLGLLVIFSLSTHSYRLQDMVLHALGQSDKESHTSSKPKVINGKTVVFPTMFDPKEDLQRFYFSHFPGEAAKNAGANFVIGASSRGSLPKEMQMETKPYVMNVFLGGNGETADSDDAKNAACKSFKKDLAVEVSKPTPKNLPIEELVHRLVDSPSEYMKEYMPFFENDVKKQFEEGTIKDHWYRLAGSSVWLESHQVHLMISRVLYSSTGFRNRPSFSMVYAQVFDENWAEVDGIELVVPTNHPDIGNEKVVDTKQTYRTMKFPSILPLPAYHNVDHQDQRYYGPEDSRILLVRNPAGYEEPLIVLNSYHRKINEHNSEDEANMSLKFEFYRSMFVAWPWQQQRGKMNMEDLADKQYDRQLYIRSVELRRENMPRIKQQKNWTPFVSFKDRTKFGYDKYVYFIYRWTNLEVLQCDLTEITTKYASCKFVYRMNDKLPEDEAVGPMRGGTSLYNINELLSKYSDTPDVASLASKIPREREIWMGFARAHIKDCGCGLDMYRPNFVVLSKDANNKFKISHISSFASFDVPVTGWDPKSAKACQKDEPSVFIPNGISAWSIKSESTDVGFSDSVTMAYSIADLTVELIQIKNILASFVQLEAQSNSVVSPLFGRSSLPPAGFDNFNIECALEGSKKICAQFGKDHANE